MKPFYINARVSESPAGRAAGYVYLDAVDGDHYHRLSSAETRKLARSLLCAADRADACAFRFREQMKVLRAAKGKK